MSATCSSLLMAPVLPVLPPCRPAHRPTSRMCGDRARLLWQCWLTGRRWPKCCLRLGRTPTGQVRARRLHAAACPLQRAFVTGWPGFRLRLHATLPCCKTACLRACCLALPPSTACYSPLQTRLAPLPSGTAASSMRSTAYQVGGAAVMYCLPCMDAGCPSWWSSHACYSWLGTGCAAA